MGDGLYPKYLRYLAWPGASGKVWEGGPTCGWICGPNGPGDALWGQTSCNILGLLWGGNSNIFYFHPKNWVNDPF